MASDGKGAACRADVELPDDGPRGVDAGQCLSLDRLEDFLVVDQGIESKGSLSYAAGLHSRRVKQVRIVFTDGSSSAGPVEGDVFLALWAGTGNASRIEFLSEDGRVLAKCKFAGDRDPC